MRTEDPIVLFGAGGHAKVVFDALRASLDDLSGLLVVDENPGLRGQDFLGLPIASGEACAGLAKFRFHVAIGRNDVRRAVAERLAAGGGVAISVVHPGALVSPLARIDAGTFLAAGCILAPDSSVARGVIVNHGAIVDHDCTVGAYSHIAPNVTLGGKVSIGAGVLVGAGAVILPGVSVGEGAVVGAGAVVTRDVAAFETVVGVPGRTLQKGNRA